MNVVAIHQPNFIPWYGYFHKIKSCTDFIFLDDVLFSRNTMINRVKIKTRNGDKTYITVPISHKSIGAIENVEISDISMIKILNKIDYNYRETKYYEEIYPWIRSMIRKEWDYLSDMNIYIIKEICKKLNIEVDFWNSSFMDYDSNLKRTDRLVAITKYVKGDIYLSGNGSDGYLEKNKFVDSGIILDFQKLTIPKYSQKYGEFIPGLSILDMLMNIGIDGTMKLF